MSTTVRGVACAAVTAFFFSATLYVTSDNSTPQVDTFAIIVRAQDLPSQPFEAEE